MEGLGNRELSENQQPRNIRQTDKHKHLKSSFTSKILFYSIINMQKYLNTLNTKIEHLKVRLIQAVDVAMFSSGYFKVKKNFDLKVKYNASKTQSKLQLYINLLK